MPFPRILHCLLCEDVRPELNKKVSLLGFYGMLPTIIRVENFPCVIEKLTFFLIGEESAGGTYRIAAEIVDQKEAIIFRTPEVRPITFARSPSAQLSLGLRTLEFPSPGNYTFKLLADDALVYSTQFELEKGEVKSP